MRRLLGWLVLLGLAARSAMLGGMYHDDTALWTRAVAVRPTNGLAWLNLGREIAVAGGDPTLHYANAVRFATRRDVQIIAELNQAAYLIAEGQWSEARTRTLETRRRYPAPWNRDVESWARTLERRLALRS